MIATASSSALPKAPTFRQISWPAAAYRYYANKPRRGLYLHHTGGRAYLDNGQVAPAPTPNPNGSFSRLFRPDGEVWLYAPESSYAAFCVLMTDIFTPTWQLNPPDFAVSGANYSADQWEIQYAPQEPYNEQPTPQQIASIRYCLAQEVAKRGPFPILGHGAVQSDKWRTEPHLLDWDAIGCPASSYVPFQGYYFNPHASTGAPPAMNPADDATIKSWLESAGVGINPDTAISQFVYKAFRDGEPPFGNWRGPAVGPEYQTTNLEGDPVTRQKFSAGIVEYNPATGGCGWAEIVVHPEIISE